MATAPSPNDLTRQQLDELDALLQRMLALPLNPPDAASPAPAAPLPLPPDAVPAAKNWRVDPPAPTPAPAPHVRPPEPEPAPWVPPAAVTAPEPERLAPPVARLPEPEPEPVAVVPPPPVKVAVPEPVPVPERRSRPKPIAVAPPPPAPVPEAPPPAPPTTAGPPVAPILWPLVALNWVTDRVLGLFGPPGWALRSSLGKNAIGLAGIGLIAYTAAHVAQQHGWVSLPVALPWPR